MPVPPRDSIEDLLSRDGECVSILLPTSRGGKEVQQARIRLKNLLREAEDRLSGNRLERDQIAATLRPGHELLADDGRWRSLEDGLALYLAPGFARHFTVPMPVEEALFIGSRFYSLPLLPLLDRRDEFLLLALSLNSVRLFAADRFEVREIDLPGVPKRLTDAVGSDYEENTSQIHTVSPGAGGAIVHGHGGSGREQEKEEAARFCIRVDAGLRRILNELDRGTLPLVVAAAEPLASTYATVSHHPRLLSEMVSGNPEALSPQELQAQGWAILDALLARELEADLERCRELLGTGRASTDPREVVLAAHDGRIDTLFVAEGAHAWGSFDAAQRRVDVEPKPSPESEELLNLAAVSTVRASGAVRLVARESMPEQADAAAVFRY